MSAFVSLAEAGGGCGGKAEVLGRLVRAGFVIPDGFVLPIGQAEEWEGELPGVLAALGGSRFAVRSSGHSEDGRAASFAGQLCTSLDVPPDRVEAEVRRVAASGEQAGAYAAALGRRPGPVAVIVQRMLTPIAAGVAFTRDPVTGLHVTVIEAVRGLGDRLVSGHMTPQCWRISPAGRLSRSGVPDVLTAEQAAEVARMAESAEGVLGGGQDVEWAITAGRGLWTLQARPITTTGERTPPAGPALPEILASGTPASPGIARGHLRVIDGLDGFARFRRDEVLVCRATSPAWTPLLARASAVVTERGGILAHAAIVARELRIPAITNVPAATDLPDGASAEVNGTTGTITALEKP